MLLRKMEACAPGQPEPETFSDVKDIEVVAHATDIIGDPGLLFHVGWSMPGASKGKNGELVKPAGWTPSVADIFDNVRMFMPCTCAPPST